MRVVPANTASPMHVVADLTGKKRTKKHANNANLSGRPWRPWYYTLPGGVTGKNRNRNRNRNRGKSRTKCATMFVWSSRHRGTLYLGVRWRRRAFLPWHMLRMEELIRTWRPLRFDRSLTLPLPSLDAKSLVTRVY